MYLHLHPRSHGGRGKRLRILGGKTRRSDIVFGEHGGAVGRGVAQNQDGLVDAVTPQVQPLVQVAYGKTGGPFLLQNLGNLGGTVAVGIGLDHGADVAAHRFLYIGKIAAQSVQVDLDPAMLLKIHS